MGMPAYDYPWHWSICPWFEGETVAADCFVNLDQIAAALAQFLLVLQRIHTNSGPAPGKHNFFRGGPLTTYDSETRESIAALCGQIQTDSATAIWEKALATRWERQPVWIHGDVSKTNLVVKGEELVAVIDFGNCGVGDPACDLTIAWTLFSGVSRQIFFAGVALDNETWDRARGWALWKALITLLKHRESDSIEAAEARQTIDEVLADRVYTGRQSRA